MSFARLNQRCVVSKKFHLPTHELVLFPNDTNSSHARFQEVSRSFKEEKATYVKSQIFLYSELIMYCHNQPKIQDFQIPINSLLGTDILWINYCLTLTSVMSLYEKRCQMPMTTYQLVS